jgi:hypothetical protein
MILIWMLYLKIDMEAYKQNVSEKCNLQNFCWCRWCKLCICVHRKTILSTSETCSNFSSHSFFCFHLPSISQRAAWWWAPMLIYTAALEFIHWLDFLWVGTKGWSCFSVSQLDWLVCLCLLVFYFLSQILAMQPRLTSSSQSSCIHLLPLHPKCWYYKCEQPHQVWRCLCFFWM